MNPFSRSHFSRVDFTTKPIFLKNSWLSGLAVVPGPFIVAYSLPNAPDFSKSTRYE